jgi:aryl-alcohol dehydrogenase-like predicted oxidoreductase
MHGIVRRTPAPAGFAPRPAAPGDDVDFMIITRRQALYLGAGTALSLGVERLRAQDGAPILKSIPSTGETIPAIGIGTNRYGVGESDQERAPLRATLATFVELGGGIIDTAAAYGTSEAVLGDLIRSLGIRTDLFIATKTPLRGRTMGMAGLRERFARLQTETIDLMQVHNLVNLDSELAAMREWKRAGRIRYVGATISTSSQFGEMERAIQTKDLDFVQFNYSLDDRGAAERLLPMARDRGLAVLINQPFGRGDLFAKVEGRELPDWASEFDCGSWAQFFLKYIISHPAVTAAIPGTRQVEHAVDNVGAARGRLPDADLRRRQESFYDGL